MTCALVVVAFEAPVTFAVPEALPLFVIENVVPPPPDELPLPPVADGEEDPEVGVAEVP